MERAAKRYTPAPETKSRKGGEQTEGRVSQIPRKSGSAEKGLPRANEEKAWEELEEEQARKKAYEAEHSL